MTRVRATLSICVAAWTSLGCALIVHYDDYDNRGGTSAKSGGGGSSGIAGGSFGGGTGGIGASGGLGGNAGAAGNGGSDGGECAGAADGQSCGTSSCNGTSFVGGHCVSGSCQMVSTQCSPAVCTVNGCSTDCATDGCAGGYVCSGASCVACIPCQQKLSNPAAPAPLCKTSTILWNNLTGCCSTSTCKTSCKDATSTLVALCGGTAPVQVPACISCVKNTCNADYTACDKDTQPQ